VSQPSIIKWNCGVNVHDQPLTVTRYIDNGRVLYRIDREAANQRDDCTWIGGLTAQNLRDIAEVLKP
jgi:hypothetical protein